MLINLFDLFIYLLVINSMVFYLFIYFIYLLFFALLFYQATLNSTVDPSVAGRNLFDAASDMVDLTSVTEDTPGDESRSSSSSSGDLNMHSHVHFTFEPHISAIRTLKLKTIAWSPSVPLPQPYSWIAIYQSTLVQAHMDQTVEQYRTMLGFDFPLSEPRQTKASFIGAFCAGSVLTLASCNDESKKWLYPRGHSLSVLKVVLFDTPIKASDSVSVSYKLPYDLQQKIMKQVVCTYLFHNSSFSFDYYYHDYVY